MEEGGGQNSLVIRVLMVVKVRGKGGGQKGFDPSTSFSLP